MRCWIKAQCLTVLQETDLTNMLRPTSNTLIDNDNEQVAMELVQLFTKTLSHDALARVIPGKDQNERALTV